MVTPFGYHIIPVLSRYNTFPALQPIIDLMTLLKEI